MVGLTEEQTLGLISPKIYALNDGKSDERLNNRHCNWGHPGLLTDNTEEVKEKQIQMKYTIQLAGTFGQRRTDNK